jgi:allantoicase
MAARQPAPTQFKQWTDLSSDILGAFVVYATDDFFAGKENLIRPDAAVWLENEYTDKGKWMDGWESQRRRTEGHDWAIVRLGAPGLVRGVLVDTAHFKGNAPQRILLEGLEAEHTATGEMLNARTDWFPLIPESDVKPDFPNSFDVKKSEARVTHVRLHIFPDGGVARLRVYGEVLADERTFWRPGSVDLGALENGATIAAVSDEFFGPPSNMLLPGRGVNMGDGWETKRRRTPGSDWAVVKLARRGQIQRMELDTHFFKGNAPQATLMECLDAEALSAKELETRLRAPQGWEVLLDKTPLVQHRRHQLEPSRPRIATHVRVHIFPHGGVNRLRLFGESVDSREEKSALDVLNGMEAKKARPLFLSFCGAERWADEMVLWRPFPSVKAFFQRAETQWWGLDEEEWLEAFAAHPRIGQKKKAASQTEKSAKWSRSEQKKVETADPRVLKQLAELNNKYFKKFGFIYIVFASGKTAPQMLSLLEERIGGTKAKEIENAAREQAKITRLRMEKWLREQLS